MSPAVSVQRCPEALSSGPLDCPVQRGCVYTQNPPLDRDNPVHSVHWTLDRFISPSFL
jgi:hypothetical protein